jgi:hypothetical protein
MHCRMEMDGGFYAKRPDFLKTNVALHRNTLVQGRTHKYKGLLYGRRVEWLEISQ